MQICEVMTTLVAFNYRPGMIYCDVVSKKNKQSLKMYSGLRCFFVFQKAKSMSFYKGMSENVVHVSYSWFLYFPI